MINKKTITLLLSTIVFIQLILISHRVSFDIHILKNFYKKDIALEKSVKDKKAYEFSMYILNENLNDFNFANFQNNERDSSLKERIISFVYPIQYKKNSKNIISRKKLKSENCSKKFEYSNLFLYEC